MFPKRILVTGGAGFIGSQTVNLLLDQGKQVVVLDNLSTGSLAHLNLRHPDLDVVEGDVLEYPLVEKLIQDADAVLHLAAIVSVQKSMEQPVYSFQVNVQGLLHILEVLRHVKHPVRLVYASSAAVYGDEKTLPCKDNLALTNPPLSPYALQKIHNENYALLYTRQYGVKSLALRYFNVYGAEQDPTSPYSGVISRFLAAYREDKSLTIFGDGQQSRDFIHVSDVAKANLLALQGHHHGTLNIATGQPRTLLQVIASLEKVGQKPIKKEFLPPRAGDIKASYAAVDLAEQYLRFKATISLEEGMKMMLQEDYHA